MCGHCRGISCTNSHDIDIFFDDDGDVVENYLSDEIFEDVDHAWNRDGIVYTGMEEIVSNGTL